MCGRGGGGGGEVGYIIMGLFSTVLPFPLNIPSHDENKVEK